MLSTRRSTANANRPVVSIEKPGLTQPTSNTIKVEKPSKKRVKTVRAFAKASSIPPKPALLGNISEHDLSLTSPITDGISKVSCTEAPKTENFPLSYTGKTVHSTLRILAQKPAVSMSGSSHDPIVVNENSSPPRPTLRVPKRKRRDIEPPEPHRFVGTGYRSVYDYGVPRRDLSGLPAHESIFNNRQNHDIYRPMSMRTVSTPHLVHNTVWGYSTPAVPFPIQYPGLAQTLSQQYSQPSFPTIYPQYLQYPIPTAQHPAVALHSEEALRRKVFECTQPLPRAPIHKQRVPSIDPDETQAMESEEPTVPPESSRPSSAQTKIESLPLTPQLGPRRIDSAVPKNSQPNLIIHRLIEHTSLMTSLLQLYPHSTDQTGLQRDIQTMLSALNQHIAVWKDTSPPDLSFHRKNIITESNTVDLETESIPTPIHPPTVENEEDKRMKQVFSAKADMWQDGTGYGVADVYGAVAAAAASSPAVSFAERRDGSSRMVGAAQVEKSTHVNEKDAE